MGPQGIYLNHWTPNFDPTIDIPTTFLIEIWLPKLPMHCLNPETLKSIRNVLDRLIDTTNPMDQYACARICIEVDLEFSLPEAIKLTVGA